MLKLMDYVWPTNLLGPYERFAIWVDGCCFSCPGCLLENNSLSPHFAISVEDMSILVEQAYEVEGITISGGEPFLQAAELARLVENVKRKTDIGVIIYTGFTIEELREKDDPAVNRLLEMTDILIDGRYIRELDDGKPYRGSSNQRIIQLTSRYADIVKEYYETEERRTEILIGADKINLVGVPDKKALAEWEKLKKTVVSGEDY